MESISHSNSLNLGVYDSKILPNGIYSRKSSSVASEEQAFSRSFSNPNVLIEFPNEVNEEFPKLFKKTWDRLVVRLCISFLIFVAVVIIQAFFISITEIGYDSSISPLSDRMHYAFDISKIIPFYIVDILIITWMVIVFIRAVLCVPTFQAISHLIRLFLISSSGYFIRGIFISVTTVPSATHNCIPGSVGAKNKILAILAGNFGLSLTCTDNIISGHSFATTIFYLFWLQVENKLVPRIFITIYYFTICFLIITTRAHYTVDVLFGISYALVLYNLYKMLLKDRISHLYDWSTSPFFIPKQLQLNGLGSYAGAIIGWFEVVELRLKLIRFYSVSDSDYHKKVIGIVDDDEFKSSFDIISTEKMCDTLCFINISLFSKFLQKGCNKIFFNKRRT